MARLPPRTPPALPPRVRGRAGKPAAGLPAGRKPPRPRPRPPKRAARLSPEDVAAGFVNPVRTVRASLGYQIVALFAAGVVLLMPVVYLTLIGGVGGAIYYHFMEHTALLELGRGRGRVLAALLYLAPGVAGGAVILALLKPLAAPEGGRSQWRVLHRQTQPTLFALIDRVCDAVSAPRPDQVRVDAQANMSAGYQGGFLGLFGGKFVLTIGVPFAAGLSAAGFAGILAHEFGHFAQRGGRGLTGAALAVQGWLARMVYQRDRVDEWIAEGSAELSGFSPLFWLCGASVWVVRRILIVLLYLSEAALSALSRQMEFDADRYKVRLCGPDAFADASRRATELVIGHDGAMRELVPALLGGSPPEDLPALCVHHAPRLSEDEALEWERDMRSQAGFWQRLFSSHPPTARRLAAARREGERLAANGGHALNLNGSATDLFGDFPALCRDVTLDLYMQMLGERPDPNDLAPVRSLPPNPHSPRGKQAEAGPTTASQNGRAGATKRRRGRTADPAEEPEAPEERPARLLPYERPYLEPPEDRTAHQARLAVRRQDAAEDAALLQTAIARMDKLTRRRMKAFGRVAELDFIPAARRGAGDDRLILEAKLQKLERARADTEREVIELERAPADVRLLSLDLFAAPGVADKLPGYVSAGIDELLAFNHAVREARPAIRATQDAAVRLTAALQAIQDAGSAVGLQREAEARLNALAEELATLNRKLLGLPDPFRAPLEVTQKPDAAARPFSARLTTATAEDGPVLLLSAVARSLRELSAAADHAERVLAARADWIAARLKLGAG
ncbi:M48 family metallopeptidase [Alienimonas californiensis]|uniref:Heat shock protein HtpX n=1 Tax=Alienimonas californiensis TaxID=2527989 RepID=A0A517P6Z2_9PLAN|nr:M48 family metallopeptidase [Alienimonas californiensis]QDT15150.1 heat shock protein HtpX [Alienimonas californiensis]